MSNQFNECETFLSDEWKAGMLVNGSVLKNHKVRQVLLVHGTFAGNNALGIFDILLPVEQILSGSTVLVDKLKEVGKGLIDDLVKDIGNYTPEYETALNDGLENGIFCERFIWGSGDFHLARLQGTLELAKRLALNITERNIQDGERILLMGHSHAGQLFALLTALLEGGEKAEQMYGVIDKSSRLGSKSDWLGYLKIIKPVILDIVTFGTPVRYAWGEARAAITGYWLLSITVLPWKYRVCRPQGMAIMCSNGVRKVRMYCRHLSWLSTMSLT